MVKNNRLNITSNQKLDNSNMLRLMQKSSAASMLENYAALNVVKHLTSVTTGSTRNYSKPPSSTNPQGLPFLPVPKLEDTLQKFLKSVQPHLTTADFAKTQDAVRKFAEKDGPKLQELLLKHSNSKENWLSDWWLTSAYLEYRDPVIVFSSPGLVFPQRKFSSESDKIQFTAKLISAALSYKQLIDARKIAMEYVGKNPLDMAQYDKIFGTCRIPGIKYDTLTYNPKSKHIAVIVNNVFFKVPVYGGANGDQILSESEIVAQLNKCVQQANKARGVPIGILSSDNRDNWGIAYNELIKDNLNKKSLAEIHSSLFVVSIDREMPQTADGDDIVTACNQLIHGGGSTVNSGNRFYDKTVQFIVGSNGINGLTYEHSPAEGQPIAVLTDYVVNYIDSKRCDNSTDLKSFEDPTALEFNVNDVIQDKIKLASNNLDKLAQDLEMNYVHFTDYGKDFIKSQKMSPDSYIQMAIQYAFYRLHKVPGAHYESAQTRMYVHGRTETIRSCSNESIAFAKAMTESGSDADRVEKLKAAVQSHKNYVSMAIQGLGVDRHFLGLKLIAKNNNIELPDIYKDAGYVKSSHMRLSTSQVASRYDAFMCYGPLTSDGYGCCYSPKDKDMWFGLSSFRSCPETSTALFKKSLEEALRHMYEVLVKAGEKPKSKL